MDSDHAAGVDVGGDINSISKLYEVLGPVGTVLAFVVVVLYHVREQNYRLAMLDAQAVRGQRATNGQKLEAHNRRLTKTIRQIRKEYPDGRVEKIFFEEVSAEVLEVESGEEADSRESQHGS